MLDPLELLLQLKQLIFSKLLFHHNLLLILRVNYLLMLLLSVMFLLIRLLRGRHFHRVQLLLVLLLGVLVLTKVVVV